MHVILQEPDAGAMLRGFTAIWVVVGTTLTCLRPSSCDSHELSYTASLLTFVDVVHRGSVNPHLIDAGYLELERQLLYNRTVAELPS